MGMIPGMSKAMKDTEVPDDAFKGVEAIIRSMTPKERSTPTLLNASRKTRIAKGSGTTVADVNKLIKQFEEMRKMMKMMSNPRAMAGLMGQMKNMR
jgi:signal recognition particle subunit SRP54